MYKILSPKGSLFVSEKILPVVEKVFEMNGSKKRVTEVAKGFDKEPNGIAIYPSSVELPYGMLGNFNNLYIGNLKPAKVQEIMKALLRDGYYDFSAMEYQTAKKMSKLTFDNGESRPYTSEFTERVFPAQLNVCNNGFNNPFNQMVDDFSCEFDDEEYYEDDGEDCGDDIFD